MELTDWPRFLPAGDAALVIEFGDRIDPQINRQVHALAESLRQSAFTGLLEAVPTYRSLLVHYDALLLNYAQAAALIRQTLSASEHAALPAPRRIDMPTVYGGEYGPDLENLAAQHGLSPQEVIHIHSQAEYLVYMMGFTPGFAYLGEVPEAIATPRLEKPRTHVPAGSVGIAGRQTGIYPIDSPGGWQIIGFTPLRWFDPQKDPPSQISAGDLVRFVPISAEELKHGA